MGTKVYSALYASRRVLALLRGDWRDVGVIVVYALGVGLCSLAFPVAVKSLVNTVAFGTLTQPLVVLTAVVGGVLAVSGVMRVFQLYTVEILQRRLVTRLGLTLSARIPHIHRQKFAHQFGPEYVLRFFEVFQVQKTLAMLLLDGIAIFFQLVLGLALVSFYHPIFLAFALVLLLLIVITFSVLGFRGVDTAVEESDAKYDVVAWLQDLATTPTVFKSYAGERMAANVADSLIHKYLKRRSRHFHRIGSQVIASLILQTAASSALLGLGGWLVIRGQLTLGQLVAAEIVFGMVLLSVAKMGKHLESFYDLSAGVVKLDAILDLPLEELNGSMMGIRQQPARLRFQEISASSLGSALSTFTDASLDISPGEKVAVWGENGSGKSYLASLAYRLIEPEKGMVLLDEFNISTIHPKELREEIALIADIEIFHGSIKDNLTLGRNEISDSEVQRALRLVGLDSDIFALPQGLATILRGTPSPLSRGQALRLMVARGFLMRPRLLILDGTLDLIDERSRKLVLTSLFGPTCPWTTLVFTHDENILPQFPKAYRISDGTFKGV